MFFRQPAIEIRGHSEITETTSSTLQVTENRQELFEEITSVSTGGIKDQHVEY